MLEDSPRFADSFGLVLLLLVVSFFVIAAAGDGNAGRIVSMVIFATTTWLALRASQVKRRILRIALALIPLVTFAAIILVLVGNDDTAQLVNKILTILLVVVAPVAILKRLVEHPVISLNTFYGAVCVYMLIAMFFATLYGLIALVSGDQFFAQLPDVVPKDTQAVDYLYFSFVTITTTGYGDFTAATNVGRMTAVLEAIFGQLYLITVVALVVQNLGQKTRLGRKMEEQLERRGAQAEDDATADADAERPLRRLRRSGRRVLGFARGLAVPGVLVLGEPLLRVHVPLPRRLPQEQRQRGDDGGRREPGREQVARAVPRERLPEEDDGDGHDDHAGQQFLQLTEVVDAQPARHRDAVVDEEAVEAEGEHVEHRGQQGVVGLLDQLADHLVLRQ